ncbi:MAG: CCA tRNA nucleotidyltransferase [Candidatus Nanoarchaeia archaeon]|jgi:tRNA nucleotidyltransferase (CCA-adding enzyme)|nr:CCA tRNA nucleotidyltransferase [Candidatus Nanoarchaeia archaeon]|tara:strand:- start:246 stop:1511 length:1266 start_codon:yes stop_codon:yes gene_type:complete
MKKVIDAVESAIIMGSDESEQLSSVMSEFEEKVTSELSKQGVVANLFVGGSVGKGTCLPGIHDIDYFMRFDLKKYGDENISEVCEGVLSSIFKDVLRLKGSRDYFRVKINDYEIEIIPVLYIKRINQAQNLTDQSPFHVNWIKKNVKAKKKLDFDMRLAKQFFRASGVYGAESWIGGFSGHVTEILVVHYGGFEKLLKAVLKWKDKTIIDVEKAYTGKDVLEILDDAKTVGPLVVVDPVDKDRNAAAALGLDKFELLQSKSEAFLKKPHKKFFDEIEITVDDIKKMGKRNRVLIWKAPPEDDKMDVSGAKMVKYAEHIARMFKNEEFIVLDSGMYWNKHDSGLVWVIVDKKALTKNQIIKGPQTFGMQNHILAFKKKYARRKNWREGYHYYAEIPRKYTKIDQILRLVKKGEEFSALKLLK